MRHRPQSLCVLAGLLFAGCESLRSLQELPVEPPKNPTQDDATITDHHGGTHHRTEVDGRLWYQTFANQLIVLDSHDGSTLGRVDPLELGVSGALVDFVRDGDRMYVVSDGDAVIELDLTDQRSPTVRQVVPAGELGIRPRAVALVDGTVWISGDGGVVDWQGTGAPRLGGERITEPVVATESGLAVPVGRRVHAIADGAFLGAATALRPLPPEAGVDGGFLFVLQGSEGASVGVMGSNVREIDEFVMRGLVREVRYANGRLWAIGDEEIGTAEVLRGGMLGPVEWIAVKGVRDLDEAGPNYLAVGGSFGRAIYRQETDSTGEGDAFIAVTREPGRLEAAVDDGRRVLTGSPEGAWIYTIGDDIEIVEREITMDSPPRDYVAGEWGDARIVDDGAAVIIHVEEGDTEWRAPDDARISTLAVMGRRLWIGHEEGLSLVRVNGPQDRAERAFFELPPPPRVESVVNLRISSGVSHVLPVRVGDEVVFVSPHGGIGIATAARIPLRDWPGDA